ncbi:MAG: hypothetical protein LBT37_05730 [Lactobacillaceae bacterium]|jgi:Zn-dependent peptidase ImmA (M78 family)|nr:hypothetical protein [Lactobacillaceae bacterium]
MDNLQTVDELLDRLITENQVGLYYDSWLKTDPDIVMLRNRNPLIIINRNFNTKIPITYRKAHELAHILYGTLENNELYEFSPQLLQKEEVVANHGAVSILCELIYSGMPMEERNWAKFMNAFCLPDAYQGVVKDTIELVR